MVKDTKIYLVMNCYNDYNKVYIGKTINKSRENDHKRKYGYSIKFKILEEIKIIREIHNNWKFLDSTDYKIDLELSTLRKKMKNYPNDTDINKTTKQSREIEACLCYFKYFKKYFSDDNSVEVLKNSIKCHCDVFLSQIIDN